MTSLNYFNAHPQPNHANASNYKSKMYYRTPHDQVIQMGLDEVETKQEQQQKDEFDEVIDKYQKLYEKETKHQNDIKVNNQFSLVDYDQGRLDKKRSQHKETRKDLTKQIEDKQTDLLKKAEADRMYGTVCEDTLAADTALVSIYPPIKVIPETD